MKNKLAVLINELAKEANATAFEHGFYDDSERVLRIFESHAPDVPTNESLGVEVESFNNFISAINRLKSITEQAAIARMHSELSEWLEGVRKDKRGIDEHCGAFLSAEIKAADVIILILDTCANNHYNIGEALIAKMAYNKSRPYKHGKNN